MTNKIDKQIGKQKFKAKRQYIVEVEFEGEAVLQVIILKIIYLKMKLKKWRNL